MLERHPIDLARIGEATHVVLKAEYLRAFGGRVAADSLEDARAVVQPVREDVDVRLVPGDELSVLPDELSLLHESISMNDGRAAQQRILA